MTCPVGLQPIPLSPSICVPTCPTQKGFEFRMKDGVPACVYKQDNSIYFNLSSVSVNASAQAVSTAINQSQQDAAVQIAKIDKNDQLRNAFQSLQDAENARDKAPDAYNTARVSYYTLLKGDGWKQEEAERVAKSEVLPKLNEYQTQLQTIQNQQNIQQKTIDIVKGVKDNVLSLKDDMKYSVDTFQKQIGILKNQIQIEQHKSQQTEDVVWTLLDTLLNMLLLATLLGLIVVTYRKFFVTQPQPQNPLAGLFSGSS
jgi:hypothetical protein